MVGIIVVLLLHLNFNVCFYCYLDDFDNVYIAHCYPYTYSQLQKYLRAIEQDPIKKNRFQRKFLCLT